MLKTENREGAVFKNYWKILAVFGIVSYFLACSPVRFSKIQAPACPLCVYSVCDGTTCTQDIVETKVVGSGIVDILVVNDNSGSMSTEQAQMGSKFPTFIQGLGKLDYRIGMITTDVSSNVSDTKANYPGPANGNGKFQDGALIEYTSGVPYLTPVTSNAAALFNEKIRREETLACEQSGYKKESCPSGDERGIFAANLALDRNDAGFLRANAPLAIIFLADEDVRSGLYSGGPSNPDGSNYGFELQDYDKAERFVARFREKFPGKTLKAHSLIVKDQACLTTQGSQGNGNPYVRGSYGNVYKALSQQTDGVIGSICSSNYENELGQIAYETQGQVASMPFTYCRPKDDNFEVSFSPKLSFAVNATADVDRLVIEFDKELPPNTTITLTYTCETKN